MMMWERFVDCMFCGERNRVVFFSDTSMPEYVACRNCHYDGVYTSGAKGRCSAPSVSGVKASASACLAISPHSGANVSRAPVPASSGFSRSQRKALRGVFLP